MRKTLRLSFSLRNTYRVNSILYALRQVPLLRRLVPADVYRHREFKLLANVLSVVWEILSVFVGKALYVVLMVMVPSSLLDLSAHARAQLLLHLFLLLSLIGATTDTYLFDPSKDKYYAVVLLGMDAREHTLVNYLYALAKALVGLTLCTLVFALPAGLSLGQCLLVPLYVVGVKMVYSVRWLWDYEKGGRVHSEMRDAASLWIVMFLLLGAAYALPLMGLMIPVTVAVPCMVAGALLGIPALWKILTFAHYPTMCKELLQDAVVTHPVTLQGVRLDAIRKSISVDTGITSQRKGLEYLNELFIKRHQGLLWRSARRIVVAALIVFVGCVVAMRQLPSFRLSVNDSLMSYLPRMVLVMYAINRGSGFTQTLFVNCDRSLLTYPFYKQPGSILRLFWIRLREIVKVNLLPAAVIGAALTSLLYLSGGTDAPVDYVVLFVSVTVMSVFLSVHYLTLYYLLQPYNAGTEMRSGTYRVMTAVTYAVCYLMMWVRLPALVFGVALIAFCVCYCIVASVLVYRLAPKTFRIRP